MVGFTLRLSEQDVATLDALCAQELRSRSDMVAYMVRRWSHVTERAERAPAPKPEPAKPQTTKPKERAPRKGDQQVLPDGTLIEFDGRGWYTAVDPLRPEDIADQTIRPVDENGDDIIDIL